MECWEGPLEFPSFFWSHLVGASISGRFYQIIDGIFEDHG